MAFTSQDYADLTRLLAEHPEWRQELRRLILADELVELSQIVRQLAEAQQRAEARLAGVEDRLARTEESVRRLIEAQQQAEARLAGVEDRLARAESRLEGVEDRLARAESRLAGVEDRLARLEETVRELVEAQKRTEEVLRQLVEGQKRSEDWLARLDNTAADLKGKMLEMEYRGKAPAYWGHLVRRLQVTPINTLEDQLEAALTSGEFRDVFRLDVLASGRPRKPADGPEIWLAVEVSSVVDVNDVDRAARQAGLLRKAGYRALPVAAGEGATTGARKAAQEQNVVLTQDGQVEFWQEALNAWAAA